MLKPVIHCEGPNYLFEILDTEDVFLGLFESLFLSDFVVKEETAIRQADAWIRKYTNATDNTKRKMCGYDERTIHDT